MEGLEDITNDECMRTMSSQARGGKQTQRAEAAELSALRAEAAELSVVLHLDNRNRPAMQLYTISSVLVPKPSKQMQINVGADGLHHPFFCPPYIQYWILREVQ